MKVSNDVNWTIYIDGEECGSVSDFYDVNRVGNKYGCEPITESEMAIVLALEPGQSCQIATAGGYTVVSRPTTEQLLDNDKLLETATICAETFTLEQLRRMLAQSRQLMQMMSVDALKGDQPVISLEELNASSKALSIAIAFHSRQQHIKGGA